MAQKLTYEYVKKYFEDNDCELLENIYVNSGTKMKYKCVCENISHIKFNQFRIGQRCMNCSGFQKHSQEYIEQYFKNQGCELLDVYVNNSTKIKYKCKCSKISLISFNNFKSGCRCINCKKEILSISKCGKNNYNWIKDRSKVETLQRIREKSITYTKKYRKINKIYGRHIHVDHIFPIKAFVENGIYDLDIINHISNLRVISSKENLSKKDKYNKNEFKNYLQYLFLTNMVR